MIREACNAETAAESPEPRQEWQEGEENRFKEYPRGRSGQVLEVYGERARRAEMGEMLKSILKLLRKGAQAKGQTRMSLMDTEAANWTCLQGNRIPSSQTDPTRDTDVQPGSYQHPGRNGDVSGETKRGWRTES